MAGLTGSVIPDENLGKAVLKHFPEHGYYFGIVIGYDPLTAFYKVKYDDGDEEELDEDELRGILRKRSRPFQKVASVRVKRGQDPFSEAPPTPKARGRGRPRKNAIASPVSEVYEAAPPKARGRPRMNFKANLVAEAAPKTMGRPRVNANPVSVDGGANGQVGGKQSEDEDKPFLLTYEGGEMERVHPDELLEILVGEKLLAILAEANLPAYGSGEDLKLQQQSLNNEHALNQLVVVAGDGQVVNPAEDEIIALPGVEPGVEGVESPSPVAAVVDGDDLAMAVVAIPVGVGGVGVVALGEESPPPAPIVVDEVAPKTPKPSRGVPKRGRGRPRKRLML